MTNADEVLEVLRHMQSISSRRKCGKRSAVCQAQGCFNQWHAAGGNEYYENILRGVKNRRSDARFCSDICRQRETRRKHVARALITSYIPKLVRVNEYRAQMMGNF